MAFIVIVSIFFLDRLTKVLVTGNLSLNESIPIIKGIFHLTLIHNRGAAFGMFKERVPLFVFTSLLAIALIYFDLKKNQKEKKFAYNFALSLILAGALGNLADRLFFGYVIDFLDFRVWPVFNVADSAITVGAVLLGYSILVKKCTL